MHTMAYKRGNKKAMQKANEFSEFRIRRLKAKVKGLEDANEKIQ